MTISKQLIFGLGLMMLTTGCEKFQSEDNKKLCAIPYVDEKNALAESTDVRHELSEDGYEGSGDIGDIDEPQGPPPEPIGVIIDDPEQEFWNPVQLIESTSQEFLYCEVKVEDLSNGVKGLKGSCYDSESKIFAVNLTSSAKNDSDYTLSGEFLTEADGFCKSEVSVEAKIVDKVVQYFSATCKNSENKNLTFEYTGIESTLERREECN